MRSGRVTVGPRRRPERRARPHGRGRWPTETPWVWCLSFFGGVLVAGTCWCFYDGFFVNRRGQLAGQPGTDLRPLLLLAVAALLGWALGCLARRAALLVRAAHRRGLAREWAEVEPVWSGRPGRQARGVDGS